MELNLQKVISKHSFGYICIISSAVLFALTHVISKILLGDGVSPLEINPIGLAATVYIINGLFFTPFASRNNSIKSVGSRNLILIALIGIAELAGLITYFFGMKDASSINASIFSNGEIIFSLLITITIFREKLRRCELTPIFMIILGMMILPIIFDFYQNGLTMSNIVFGDVLLIVAGIFYAIDVNICKFVSSRVSSTRITQLYSFFAGGIALVLLVIFQIPYHINLEQLAPISLLAILGTGLATIFFLMALRLIGAIKTIMIYSTTSIFGIIFSGTILLETVTLTDVISILLVISGIYLLRRRFDDKENTNQSDHLKINDKIKKIPLKQKRNLRTYLETNLHLKTG